MRHTPALSVYRRSSLVIEQNNATGAVAYWQHGDPHSEADSKGISLAEYAHMLYGLIRQAKAKSVLMIGCGGGSVATMLHRAGVRVTIVDIDAKSFEIARLYFHLPEATECHVADGAEFLRGHKMRYDAIVLDAFFKNAVPKHLLTLEFFAAVKSRMKRGGIFLINMIAGGDEDRKPAFTCFRMTALWRQVRLLDGHGGDNRNVIAMAGAVARLKVPRLLMKPARRARAIARHLKAMHVRDFRR